MSIVSGGMGAKSCSLCGARAVTKLAYSGAYLCAEHFIRHFEEKALRTVKAFRMLERGERVAVAVSGGKDSLALLYFLSKYRSSLEVELVAVLVDEGIRGYRPPKIDAAERYAKEWGIDLVVRSFEEEFGYTLDDAVRKLVADGLRYKPCTVCGIFRRYALNKAALELGADKVATAHNLDDEAQAFLLNAAQANYGAIAREGPVTPRAHPKLVPRVKPFYFIPEKEVLIYALLQKIETPDVECPYIVYSSRHVLRRWLNAVSEGDPAAKHRVMAVKAILSKLAEREIESFQSCAICGMPSSGSICKACQMKNLLAKN